MFLRGIMKNFAMEFVGLIKVLSSKLKNRRVLDEKSFSS